MRGRVPIEPRRQPFRREARRRADHQHMRVASLAQTGNRLADMEEAGLQSGIELPPRAGQRDGAHPPFEQFQPEEFFQPADLMAQRARRHVQLARRPGQAEMPRRGLEGTQRIEWRERIMHETCSTVVRRDTLCHSDIPGSICGPLEAGMRIIAVMGPPSSRGIPAPPRLLPSPRRGEASPFHRSSEKRIRCASPAQ
jgi:hypothetical protein